MKLLKRLVRDALDRTVIPFLNYIELRTRTAFPVRTVQQELALRTAADCADYVQANMPKALQFNLREDLWKYAWSKKNPVGLIAEFGVWNGYSINFFAKKTSNTIYGFDSFIGLQEDWSGADIAKGGFDRGGQLPKVAPNVRLFKGWFHETLPGFLAEHTDRFAFIHVDCDTYEATRTLFELLDSRLQEGTIIVFDDYFGYRGWRDGEHKALQEFALGTQTRYEYLGFASAQVAIRISQRG